MNHRGAWTAPAALPSVGGAARKSTAHRAQLARAAIALQWQAPPGVEAQYRHPSEKPSVSSYMWIAVPWLAPLPVTVWLKACT